jgi:lipid-binding SYLF domain-containing protein
MKTINKLLLLLALLGASSLALAEQVEDYSKTIDLYKNNATVAPYFSSAYGYAVFPNIGKGGVGVGGAYGKGQVYLGGKVVGFTSMTQLSIGLQLGGQAFSQIIFFQDERAYNDFTWGNFEFDAQASAIAITASAQANAGTTGTGASAGSGGTAGEQAEAKYYKGMQAFTIGKGGLMFEATIAGQKFKYKAISG